LPFGAGGKGEKRRRMPKTIKVEFKVAIPDGRSRKPHYYSRRDVMGWIRSAIFSIESPLYPGLCIVHSSVEFLAPEDEKSGA